LDAAAPAEEEAPMEGAGGEVEGGDIGSLIIIFVVVLLCCSLLLLLVHPRCDDGMGSE